MLFEQYKYLISSSLYGIHYTDAIVKGATFWLNREAILLACA